MAAKKTILLSLEGKEFEISFNNNNDASDVDALTRAVHEKSHTNPFLKSLITGKTVAYFETESVVFPGRFTVIGNTSPIKHGSIVKCHCINVGAKLGLPSETVVRDLSPQFQSTPGSPASVNKTPKSVSCESSLLSPFSVVTDSSRKNGDLHLSDSSASGSNYSMHDRSCMGGKGLASDPVALNTSHPEPGTSGTRSIRKEMEDQKPGKIPVDYELPKFYGTSIDKKMKQTSLLTNAEINFVIREVVHSLRAYTFQPSSIELTDIAYKLIDLSPSLQVDNNDRAASANLLKHKLRRRFEKERQTFVVKGKGGRPKKKKNILSPGVTSETVISDTVSYQRNVEELNRLYRENRTGDEVKILLKLTHKGRRAEILNSRTVGIGAVNSRCPYLSQPAYLLMEFEEILGEGVCSKFRQNWMNVVPKVLRFARGHKTASRIIRSGRYATVDEDFQLASRAAMEVLPVMLLANRRFSKSERYFFDPHVEGTDIRSIIAEERDRLAPFVVAIGDSITVVADRQPFLAPANYSEAVLCLMASYYVYNFQYPAKIKPTLLFLQSECMELSDDLCRFNATLSHFLRSIEENSAEPE